MAKHGRGEKPASRTKTPPRRRNILVSGVIGLALVVGVATWFFLQKPASVGLAAQYRGGPRLLVDPELIDFGPVRFDRMVEARFRLRNVGDQPLRLAMDRQVEAVEGC